MHGIQKLLLHFPIVESLKKFFLNRSLDLARRAQRLQLLLINAMEMLVYPLSFPSIFVSIIEDIPVCESDDAGGKGVEGFAGVRLSSGGWRLVA